MSKYIIDVGDAYAEYICGKGNVLCLPVRINEFEDNWLNTNIPLTPYTGPDLEQVREEAYEQGLSDAWEAAQKIANMPYDEEEKVFGSGGWTFIINHTASEAIEKLRQYEQEQEEQESITVEDVMRQYLDTFCTNETSCSVCPLHTLDFTCGRGYSFLTDDRVSNEEVRRAYAIVLAKMKE